MACRASASVRCFLLVHCSQASKTCRKDILDPTDVTVSDVCLDDIDLTLDPISMGQCLKQPLLELSKAQSTSLSVKNRNVNNLHKTESFAMERRFGVALASGREEALANRGISRARLQVKMAS